MQVKVLAHALYTIGLSFAAAYFASFPLVGWRFLVPGSHTFGLLCATGLTIIGVRVISNFATLVWTGVVLCGLVYSTVVSLVAVLLATDAIHAKDYFIIGMPVSAALAIGVMVSEARSADKSVVHAIVIAKLGALWLMLLGLYFALPFVTADIEILRFVRLQLLSVPAGASASVCLAFALRLLVAHRGSSGR